MTKLDQDIKTHWNYFEVNHGKGAVDVVGGMVKHAVFCHIQSGHLLINSPQQFAEYADKLLENVSVIYIPTESLELQYHDKCRQKSVYVCGTLKVHYVDQFFFTDSAVMKFYETTISKQVIWEMKHCMQGQDDDASSFEDDHAPRSIPENVEFQVGNYYLVNYEEELWPNQIIKMISSNLIHVKCYEKATAPAGSTWRWPKKNDEQNHHIITHNTYIKTPKDVPGSIRNLVTGIPELDHIWG